jgi:hypothetical protein
LGKTLLLSQKVTTGIMRRAIFAVRRGERFRLPSARGGR